MVIKKVTNRPAGSTNAAHVWGVVHQPRCKNHGDDATTVPDMMSQTVTQLATVWEESARLMSQPDLPRRWNTPAQKDLILLLGPVQSQSSSNPTSSAPGPGPA